MRKKISKFLIFVLLLFMSACTKNKQELNIDVSSKSEVTEKPVQLAFNAFDTNCSIAIYGAESFEEGQKIISEMTSIVNAYESQLSKTIEGSDIYEINHRTTDSVMITDLTANIFEIAKGLYDWSYGKFDISCGTLINLWDIKNRKTLPEKNDISEAKSHCGNFNYTIERDVDSEYIKCNRITFHGDKKTVYDLGALAKGFCCDSLKSVFEEKNVKACIVNLGGNVCCMGEMSKRKDGAFNVGIYKPFDGGEIIDTVKVVNKNVITSGNYQRYFKIDGDEKIYHHIIDPISGYPTDNELNSVTIISENGLLGDYLSTACMLLGIDNSKQLIDYCSKNFNDKNIQAIYVDKNNNITKYPENIKTY